MSSYIALYRKWRPSVFADVIGQEHITDVLRGEIMKGSVSHAYLFCGSRGTGKTTCAKILAKAVSCLSPIDGDPCGKCENCLHAAQSFDISEIDAASNNGVDNIRELREEVLYPPTEMKKRVYIIDEVHMLSIGAFNALLKTLEEPPEHAMFILATTELNKIPATILSRCKRFDFHRITPDNIAKRLKMICESESIPMTDEAIMLISRLATGAMRDALSMLELFVGKTETIDEEACAKALGVIGRGPVMKLLEAVAKNDCPGALSVIASAYSGSKDMGVLLSECRDAVRDMLMIKYTSCPEEFVEGSSDVLASLTECAKLFTKERLIYSTEILDEAQNKMAKTTFSRRAVLETCIIRLCDLKLWSLPESLNTRISELEAKLASGVFTVKATSSQAPSPTMSAPDVSTMTQDNTADTGSSADFPPETVADTPQNEDIPFGEPPFDVDDSYSENSDSSSRADDTTHVDSDNDKQEKAKGEGNTDASPKDIATKDKSTSSEVSSDGTASDKRTPLTAFPEILDEIRERNKILVSMMVGAKGYITASGKVIIAVMPYAITMLRNDQKKTDLIISTTKKYVGDVQVEITVQGAKAEAEWDL